MEASLAEKLALFLILIGSLSVHEWAHAFAADRQGDPTPRAMGRLTLNPLAHIDLLGTVIIPLTMILLAPGFAILGWGKPVMINPRNFKQPVKGDIITSLAGPVSNLVLALITAVIFGLVLGAMGSENIGEKATTLGLNIIYLNVLLAVFNMIPIPPLDGSHLLRHAVRMSEATFIQLAQWGSLILIVLINIPMFRELLGRLITIVSFPFLLLMDWAARLFAKGV